MVVSGLREARPAAGPRRRRDRWTCHKRQPFAPVRPRPRASRCVPGMASEASNLLYSTSRGSKSQVPILIASSTDLGTTASLPFSDVRQAPVECVQYPTLRKMSSSRTLPAAAIFTGLVDLTFGRRRSAEAEVELKAVQPRDMRVDVFAFQAVGKALVVLPELVGVGGVVVGDHDRVVADADVALQARQERLGEMTGIPRGVGFAEQTAEFGAAPPGRSGPSSSGRNGC